MNELLLDQLAKDLAEIKQKLSMADDTIQIRNSRFYLPNYPNDLIQNQIVLHKNYWEFAQLKRIDNYLPEEAVIVDCGANIGNHTLYWANERHAKKIYAFEPVESTFEILERNVELNKLKDKTVIYKLGLSDEITKGNIKLYDFKNIGGTRVQKSELGNIDLITLDSLEIQDKIDLIKIDVEDNEIAVLMGAVETLEKYKPVVVIESFENNKNVVDTIFKELNYARVEELTPADFIYKYVGQ